VSKVNVNEVRAFLYDTMSMVRDGKVDRNQALSINEMAKTMVESAKVEIEFIDRIGGMEKSDFLVEDKPGVKRHRLT